MQKTLGKVLNKSNNIFRDSMIMTFVIAIVAHGFIYLNYIPQHDSINHTLFFAGGHEISLGRFLLPVVGMIKGNVAIPWISGLLSILYISLMVVILCKLFNFDRYFEIFIVASSLSVSISLIEMYSTFIYVSDVYMLSALLAVYAAYALIKYQDFKHMALSSLSLICSLGLYDGEIVIFALVLLMDVFVDAIRDESFRNQFMKWIRWCCTVAVSLICWFIIYKLLVLIGNISVGNSYGSVEILASMSPKALVLSVLHGMYLYFDLFIGQGNMFGCFHIIASAIMLFASIISLVVKIIRLVIAKNITLLNILEIVVVLLIFPIVSVVMIIVMQSSELKYYVVYGVSFFYIFIALILKNSVNELRYEKFANYGIACLSLVILLVSVRFSNATYTIQKLTYDRTIIVMGDIINELSHLEEYIPGETEVIVLGNLDSNPKFKALYPEYGHYSYQALQKVSFTYDKTIANFSYIMGMPMVIQESKEIRDQYKNMEEVQTMPMYPTDGYVKFVDGRAIVNLAYSPSK